MGNMAYCRYHNTAGDLEECLFHWDEECSPEEEKMKEKILRLCEEIVEKYGHEA